MTIETTPPLAAPWMHIALLELGVTELTGTKNNLRIIDYHASTSLKATQDSIAWCSSFVNWVVAKAGYKGTNSAAARSWLNWGVALNQPRYGAIVVFRRDSAGPNAGHVGLYVDAPSDSLVSVLSGNQDNAVRVKNYPAADLLAVRWP